jgi:hypothetical protein
MADYMTTKEAITLADNLAQHGGKLSAAPPWSGSAGRHPS